MKKQSHLTPKPGNVSSGPDAGKPHFFQPLIQPKLKVSPPGDALEREADQVADKVTQPSFFKPAAPPIQRVCEHCAEEEEKLQREEEHGEEGTVSLQASSDGDPVVSNDASQAIERRKGSGAPLPGSTKNFMENRFDRSFADVRLHTDGEAARLSDGLNAQAFTHGNDIYFNSGKFDPGSSSGRHLLAHELTHVVQQNGNSIHRAPKPPNQQKSLQVWKNAVIMEHAYKKVWVDHLYPGTLVTGYVRIELINIPPDVAAEFLPPEAMGGGQGKLDLEGGREEGSPVEGMFPEQPEYFEKKENTGPVNPEHPVEMPETMPSPPVAKGKGIVIRVNRRISIVTRNQVKAEVVMIADTDLPKSYNIKQLGVREILEEVLNYPVADSSLSILFNHTFPGEEPDSADPIHDQQATALNDLIRKHAPDLVGIELTPYQQYNAAIRLLLAYVPHAAIALQDYSRKLKGKEAKTLEEAEKQIRSMGKRDGITVQTPDGKYLTYELTQMDLFDIINELRHNDGAQHDLNWRLENKVKAEKIFLNGKELPIQDMIDNLYYVDPDAAASGHGKSAGEAIIYRMLNSGFYARKPIAHDEAIKLWDDIDDRVEFPERLKDIVKVDNGIFVALYVKGTGQYHTINEEYIEGKNRYMKNLDYYNQDVTVKKKDAAPDDPGATPLMFDIYYTPGGGKILHYIEAQLDKGVLNDTAFRDTAKDKKYLQSSLSLIVMNKLKNAGNRLALDIVTKAHAGLKLLNDDEDAFRAVIMRFPDMTEEQQNETLTMLGVEEGLKEHHRRVLADKEAAYQIAFGIKVKTVGLEPLRSGLKTITTELGTAKEQMSSGALHALLIEGPFGNVIREQVYKQFGFTKLTAETFPHHDQTSGVFPSPLEGNALDYSGLYEQIYANFVAHSANAMTVMKIGTITMMALVTAAIVILSGGIGVGVAAAFAAEGTAGFTLISIGVSSLAMTVMSEALSQAMGAAGIGPGGALGKDKEYYGADELLKAFGKDLILSTIFAGVGRMLKNVGNVWRITATGGLFMGYSLAERMLTGQGFPKGRELGLFVYEQLLTLAAIEAGGVLARGLMEGMYVKGLTARVGILNRKITPLKAEITTGQKKLAEMLAKDNPDAALKLETITTQKGLLEKYLKILQEIKTAVETKEVQYDRDVDHEIRQAENALEKIKLVEFQQKTGFKQNPYAADKISYKPGDKSVQEIKDFYGADKVTGPDKDGVLKVKTPEGKELTFYPETKEREMNRSILERPAAKLDAAISHSIDVGWTNIDSIPDIILVQGSTVRSTAKDFWHEKGPDMYDQVYGGEYYIKYDKATGRLLFGEVQSGRILGFFQDEARLNPGRVKKLLVEDPVRDMSTAVEKLQRYFGLKDPTVPLAGTYSSGASIVAHPDKTTTILGSYVMQDGKVTHKDMQELFENFGNLKNADFGERKGGFNVLNVGDGFYEPGTFFEKYNRPWLEQAIKRDDIFYVATDPTRDIFIFERDKATNKWVYTDPPANTVRKRTGFGKEVLILEQNGYNYDAATKTYKK